MIKKVGFWMPVLAFLLENKGVCTCCDMGQTGVP
jgi:hypothetical protein